MITVRELIVSLLDCDMDAPVMAFGSDGLCYPAQLRYTDDEFECPAIGIEPEPEVDEAASLEYDQQLDIDAAE